MRVLRWIGIALVVVLVALQFVPYGRRHTNPPARVEPRWDAPATRAFAVRACYDCHRHTRRVYDRAEERVTLRLLPGAA